MFSMLFFVLISVVERQAPLYLSMSIIFFILASLYSFFNPVKLTIANAMQSNATQLALVGLGTGNILFGGVAGFPFYVLYLLMCMDVGLSSIEFISQTSHRIQRASQDSLLEKGQDDYDRIN